MSNIYFISGIDTDCGKTYITALLARNLKKAGFDVITQKITQTGCQGISDDIQEHRRIMECNLFPEDIDGTTCPYVFKFAASPHLSAEMEQTKINPNVIHNATKKLANSHKIVLVEGVGGLCVPLTKSLLLIDYFAQEKHPLILVASSKLGSINHTILSLEICKQKNIELHAIIYNILPNSDEFITKSSFEFISDYVKTNFPKAQISTSEEIKNNQIKLFVK